MGTPNIRDEVGPWDGRVRADRYVLSADKGLDGHEEIEEEVDAMKPPHLHCGREK